MVAPGLRESRITYMKQEFGRCETCPKGIQHRGWLGKLFKGELVPDPNCRGRETINIQAVMQTDVELGISSRVIYSVDECPKEITPEMRAASELLEATVEQHAAQSETELSQAWNNMTKEERNRAADTDIAFLI